MDDTYVNNCMCNSESMLEYLPEQVATADKHPAFLRSDDKRGDRRPFAHATGTFHQSVISSSATTTKSTTNLRANTHVVSTSLASSNAFSMKESAHDKPNTDSPQIQHN